MATASSIEVVNDANGTAYGFLVNDGQLIQCHWDSQAERWVEAQLVPGALGGNAVQATYLDNLWDNKPGGSSASGQSWDPGIVLLYRKGQDSQAEIYAVFGGWNENGELQWSQEVQLTDDTVNDKEFSLVAADNGQFVLVTQKQQEIQSLSANLAALESGSITKEQAAPQAINGLVQPDSDLYTTSFQILNNGPGLAPELQSNPVKATPASSPTWTTVAPLESASKQAAPAPALAEGAVGSGTDLSRASLFAANATAAGGSGIALASSAPEGLGASEAPAAAPGATAGSWEVGKSSNPTTVQLGLLEVARWKLGFPALQNPYANNDDLSGFGLFNQSALDRFSSNYNARLVLLLSGFYGLTNTGGTLAFRSQAKLSVGALLGDRSSLREGEGSPWFKAVASSGKGLDKIELSKKYIIKLMLAGAVGSTTYYGNGGSRKPVLLQGREAVSFDAGLTRLSTWATYKGTIPTFWTIDASVSNAVGYQWITSIGDGVNPLPQSGLAGKILGGVGDSETYLTIATGIYGLYSKGLKPLTNRFGALSTSQGVSEKLNAGYSKLAVYKNLINAAIGTSSAVINPILLAKNASQYQDSAALNYQRNGGIFNTSQAELVIKYNGAFNARATFFNKYNGTTTNQVSGAYSDTWAFDVAVGVFGAYQPVLALDNTYSSTGTPASTSQATGTTASSSPSDSPTAPAPAPEGGSILYAPSQGSSLYWAASTGDHLLSGQNTQALRLQTLIASSANLMQTSGTLQQGNGGSGLNNGTYTNVRLLGVTPGGEDDLAEATVVVAGGQITSLVITRGGTYAYLPEYANSISTVVVVPDLLSINASTGTSIVNSGAIGKGPAKPPTIILQQPNDSGSWTSQSAAVIQSVVVSDGGSGYAPFDANSQQVKTLPVDNSSSYVYTGVGYSVFQGSTLIASLVTGSAANTTATVTLINGAIARVSLDQPFYCAPPASGSPSYNLVLDLPTGVAPTESAVLTVTPTAVVYNNFIDEHSFFTERSVPGAAPSTSGVYIADGNNDQTPLLASEKGNAIGSRVVFVDGEGNNANDLNTYYLNGIQWNSTTWQAGTKRDVNPSPSLSWKAEEQQFSLARLPVATKLPSTSSFKTANLQGGDLVAWVEVIDRPVPNSGSSGAEDYQSFYDNYFSNQQIAFSIKTTGGWQTNPFNYIAADNAIIDNLDIALVPGSTPDDLKVLLTWSETSIAAVKGLAPLSETPQSGKAPTVIKAALFDPTSQSFQTPQTITWASADAVGIGVADLSISSMPMLDAAGNLQQEPVIAWSQNVAVPYEQAVLTSNPYIYLQMDQGQSGVGNYNIGSIGDSPAAFSSASSTGLDFDVTGALAINSDAAIENIDGTGVLSTGVGSLNTFLPPTAVPSSSPSSGVARSPYTIEFWARVPETGNGNGAGLFALGQPSITQGQLPKGWLLSSSFVVDQISYQDALGRGLITSIPTGTDSGAVYGYAWAVVADGTNTTALGGNGGSGLYSNALQITNLQAGTTLAGVSDFLASYGVAADALIGTSGSAAGILAEVPATSLEFDTALLDGAPNSSLNTIAVSTDQALMNSGLVTTASTDYTNNSNLKTLFQNLWDYQQKAGKAKVNFGLNPSSSAVSSSVPPQYAQENYGGLSLDFALTYSTAVSVNGLGQVVFDVGSSTSLLSTLTTTNGASPLSINDGKWHYIVATYLPDIETQVVNQQPVDVALTTGSASLYVDNQLVGQTALSDVFSPATEAQDALLIYLNNGSAIDELALYQQSLSGVDLSTPSNPSGNWPVMTSADATGLLASLGVNIGGLSTAPGVETGAVNLHWKARSVDPNGAENATFYTNYDESSTSWSAAQLLNPVGAPVATQTSGSRSTSLQDADLLQINPADWTLAGFNPAKQQLQSVTVNLLSSSSPSTIISTYTLDPSQVLIGDQTLLSRQPRATSSDLAYTFLTNTPAVGLLVPKSKFDANAHLYSYALNFFDPASNTYPTFSSAQLNAGGSNAVLPVSGPRISTAPDPSSFTSNPLYPQQIVSADILEQAPYQLQYVDSGEVIRSQQNPANTSKGFGLSEVAGRYTSTISGHTGTAAGWLAISQPFTPSAGNNPAGAVYVQFTGLYPTTPSNGNPPVNLSPTTWLNALARSNFNADAPNLPLLQDAQSQSSSGGLLIKGDPSEGWGGNLGRVMLVADLDGDGCDELIISAPNTNSGGTVYIVAGSWIQQNLNSNPEILDLNNPDALGAGVVTVLTGGSEAQNSQFGSALAFDGTTLYIGAPTYSSDVVSGDSTTAVAVGAVYSYGPTSAGGTAGLSLYQMGIGGSLVENNPVGVATTSYWGERLGSSLAASVTPGSNGNAATMELAIGAPGLVAGLQYSGQQKLQNEQNQITSLNSKTASNPTGDGALIMVQLPSAAANSINIPAGSGSYTDIATKSKATDNQNEASAYMQRLKALMTDPIVQATTFYDQSLTANEIGAVYYKKSGATSQESVFYGASPWNTGSTGFGNSVAFADLTNSNANTIVIGADTSGGSGAAYFIDPGKLPATTLGQTSSGANQYLAHLASGLILHGQNANDHFGNGLVSTGDVNADPNNPAYSGYNDLLINAYNAQSGMGIGYVLFGADDILGDPTDPASGPYTGTVSAGGIGTVSNNQGSVDLNILSESGSVSQENVGLGSFNTNDVNGDGINDVLLGGRGAGNGYLTWGKAYLQDISNFQLNKLASDQGFLLEGLATTTEASLRSIGDFNADGYDDFYSVTPGDYLTAVRVELGGSTEAILADYQYNDFSFYVDNGTQIFSAGDLNADGFDDLALFLPQNLSADSQGAGSTIGILYGRPSETLPLASGFGLLAPAGLTPPSQDVEYGLSDAAPCFLAVGDTIYAVVKAWNGDSLWFSRSADSGNSWATWVDISTGQPGITSSLPVSLAYYENKLVLAFVNGSQGISLSSWDPSTSILGQWSAPLQVQLASAGSTSTTTPATALAPLLLNQGTELSLYWVDQASSAITAASSTAPADAAGWTPPTSLSSDAAGTPILSATALAGTLLEGTPVLAYGQANASGPGLGSIALLTSDSGGVLWQQQDSLPLTGSVPSNAPGLAATGTGLALTYTNADQQVVVNQLRLLEAAGDSPTWLINTNPQWQSSVLEGVSSSLGSSPVVVNDLLLVGTVNSSLDVGLQAVSSSDAVPWLTWMDSTVQLPDGNGGSILSQRAGADYSIGGLAAGTWQDVGGGAALSPAALARNGNTVYMAVRGTDDHLYWNSSSDNGKTWNSWQGLPTTMGTYTAPSIAYFNKTLYLCYVAAGSNDLNITYLNGSSWETQYQISGQTATAAAMIVEGDNLAVYFVSEDASDRILKSYTSSSTPTASSWTNSSVLYGSGSNQTASSNLALTRYNGQTYIAYQGGTDSNASNTIYLTTASDSVANGSSPIWTLLDTPAGIDPVLQRGVGLTNNSQGLVLTYTDTNQPKQVAVQLSNADDSDWLALNDGQALSSDIGYTPLITADAQYPLLIAGMGPSPSGSNYPPTNVQLNGLNAQVLNSSQTGSTLSAVGDINGDGFDDLAITANNVAYAPSGDFAASTTELVTGLRLVLGAEIPGAIKAKNASTATQQSVQIASLYPQQSAPNFTPYAALAGDTSIRLNGASDGSTYRISSTATNAAGTAVPTTAITADASDPASLKTLFSGATASASTTTSPGVNGLSGRSDLQTLGGFGDLNGDGYTDYLRPDGLADLFLSDGSLAYSVWSIRAAGDVNGNGLDDVILTLTPPESNNQLLQPVLLDGAMFKVIDNQFSLSQAGGSYEGGWTSAGLKIALNHYPYPAADGYIPSLQVWFEPIQSYIGYDDTSKLETSSNDNQTIPITLHTRAVGASASTVGEDGTAYVAMSNVSPDANGNNYITLSYGQPDSSSWTTVDVQNFVASKNNEPVVTSVAIYQGHIYIAYTSNVNNAPALNIVTADLASDLTQSSSWTNANPNGIQGSGVLVNEGNRLALYYTAYSAAYNRQASNTSLYALYSTGFSDSGVNWASSGTALKDSSGTSLSASNLAGVRFRGQTVLAFYSGSYSNSNTTLTFAQPVSAEPGAALNTYRSSLGFSTGGVPPQLSLGANASQLYLNNSQYSLGDSYIATGGAYNVWSNQQNNITNLSNDTNSTSNIFVSEGQLYVTYANQISGKPNLHVNPTSIPPSTATQVSLAGYSIDGNIDINADGYNDILISDPSNPSEGLANQYALFGGDFLDIANQIGTPSDDTLLGTPLVDIIAAIDGSDRIEGRGGKDVILAGNGDDQISLIDNDFLRIDAGAGIDTLLLQGLANQNWSFTEQTQASADPSGSDPGTYYIRPGNRLKSVELISSVDYGANTLSFDCFGVENLNYDQVLFLVSDAQDSIELTGFSRNSLDPKADIVFGGARWNGYTASDSAAVVFVLVPTSQTAVNSEGENIWLTSHVSTVPTASAVMAPAVFAAEPQAAVAPSFMAAGVGSDPADAYLPWLQQQAGTQSVQSDDYTVTAMPAREGESLRYRITRQGSIGKPLAILYSSTSNNGTTSLGVDLSVVVGVLQFKPGEISKMVTVPTVADRIAEGQGEKASLSFQQVDPERYTKDLNLLIQPSLPVVLSDFNVEGGELRFRADGNSVDQNTLSFRISQRASAESATVSSSRELKLADFRSDGAFNLAGDGPLSLDQDGRANQQVSTRLRLNLDGASDLPLVSVLGPELKWQSSVQLLNGNTVRFSQDAPLTIWRADSAPGLVTFGLQAGARSLTLITDAQGGSAGSLNPSNANSAEGWQTTEALAIGSRAITDAKTLSGPDWTPTASRDGVSLELLNLAVDGNQVTASFAGGVSGVFWQASGNAPTVLPAPAAVEVQRLAGYDNSLGFYTVDSITGNIGGLNPGDKDYLQAALARSKQEGLLLDASSLPEFGQSATYNTLPLDTRERYGLLLLQNGDSSVIYSSFAAANAGGSTQMVSLSNSANNLVLGIEDQAVAGGNGDIDFNDLIVRVQNVAVQLF
ncbi:MAG: hypothetical protein WCI65_08550 [Synechococcaceae cyanobacterium ELA263]